MMSIFPCWEYEPTIFVLSLHLFSSGSLGRCMMCSRQRPGRTASVFTNPYLKDLSRFSPQQLVWSLDLVVTTGAMLTTADASDDTKQSRVWMFVCLSSECPHFSCKCPPLREPAILFTCVTELNGNESEWMNIRVYGWSYQEFLTEVHLTYILFCTLHRSLSPLLAWSGLHISSFVSTVLLLGSLMPTSFNVVIFLFVHKQVCLFLTNSILKHKIYF